MLMRPLLLNHKIDTEQRVGFFQYNVEEVATTTGFSYCPLSKRHHTHHVAMAMPQGNKLFT